MDSFLTLDRSNEGNRGRPACFREVSHRIESIYDERENELGSIELSCNGKGVVLTAEVSGRKHSITFPAKVKKARKQPVAKAA